MFIIRGSFGRDKQMISENEIRNQVAIAETLKNKLIERFIGVNEKEYLKAKGYVQGLKYVLGEKPARYNKEDI